VIRLFRVYYPVRTLVLLLGEALIVLLSFALGVWTAAWLSEVGFPRPALLQSHEGLPLFGLFASTGFVLLLSHGLDLYDSGRIGAKWDEIFRLLLVLGLLALVLSAVGYVYSYFLPGQDFLPRDAALVGLVILTIALLGWRVAYSWLVQQKYFRERVYVLGTGERAQRLRDGLRERPELGIEVVGWTGDLVGELTRESVGAHLLDLVRDSGVHRVIVAMPDRRGTLPVDELLKLRLDGLKVEEATSWLERINGRIEVENLNPSWLIFADGFRFSVFFRLVRRILNFSVALIGLILALPLLPFIALGVKLGSPGPILYRQKRVGRGSESFYCYKFRTMRQDAEADTGATWASDNDPRITRVGGFLRLSRLDEIPQLWCVLKGDMHFVGPRPERPEFVEWLSKEIPYYGVRHTVRPGITGWAQVQYKYGNTMEDAREKLQYDLFYIKNASVGLDFWIVFQTIKIVLLGRGAK
jgi:sugar transferase (PEP-CTERM system associated)